MEYENTKQLISNFTQLNVWKRGHEFALAIYKITRSFPKEEKYGLIDQMRRAAVSITSNIAEGFGRSSARDKTQFYIMARGSLTEVQNQLYIARDVGYLNAHDFQVLQDLSVVVSKLVNGLIKSIKTHIT